MAASITAVVRTVMEALTESIPQGEIDGIDMPIAAGAMRRMAAYAGIISTVTGGPSEVLDQGRLTRLFTPAQKVAIVEPDCGGAFPACSRPPSRGGTSDQWWHRDNGRTDLSNGVILCVYHHHVMPSERWAVRVTGGRVWFVPLSHVDARRRPRANNSIKRWNPELVRLWKPLTVPSLVS